MRHHIMRLITFLWLVT